MLSALGLCLVATVHLQIEATTGVEDGLAQRLADQLRSAIEVRTGRRVVSGPVTDPNATLVSITIDGGATQIQLKAKRTDSGRLITEHTVRGPFAEEGWQASLSILARKLFSEVPTTGLSEQTEEDDDPGWFPIALLGASVACVASSAGFAVSSVGARSELTDHLIVGDEAASLSDRAATHGAIGVSLAAAAVVAAGTSIVLLLE